MTVATCLFRSATILGAAAAATLASAQEITFQDQRGKTITLAEPTDSIVILPKPIPFMYIAVDGGPQDLKGINPATKAVMLDGIISQIFPALADINISVVTTGFVPNVEELLNISPDVVMQWSGDDAHLIEPMERVGIKEEKRTTMVYIDTLANNEITIFPAAQFFFTAPGLRNLAVEAGITGSSAKITAETLLAWDPDIIVMNHYDVNQKPSDIYDNPVFSSLKAVQNHRIFKKPRLDPGSQEAPIIWQWMARVGYPEVFDFDLRSEVRTYYTDTYGTELTPEQVDGVLNIDANVSSPDYRVMFGS
jgi:iron complex transport system substrate-binding protein